MVNEKRLFLSYCWADKAIADEIDNYCAKWDIPIVRDIRDIGKWESIKQYMRKIRSTDYAIIIITPHYLKSKNCMYEVMELMKEINYNKRVIPLVLPDSNIFSPAGRLGYIKHWETEYKNLSEEIRTVESLEATIDLQKELKIIDDIYTNIGEFLALISDMNCPQDVVDFCNSVVGKLFLPESRYCCVNGKFTFSTYFVGTFNRFTHAAALAVSRHPGSLYNPLFIYGEPGTGKTHLLHAIANSVVKSDPTCKVVYHSCESFVSDLINAIQNEQEEKFRQQFLAIDMLIIDDIQFLKGKEFTQEKIFHIFNSMYQENKQVIVAANCPVADLKLTEWIRDRFEWGLMTDISYPDYDERLAYLKWKYSRNGSNTSEKTLENIVRNSGASLRQLEGTVTNYLARNELL